MKKILVALDYSPASKNAFEYALILAKALKAELTLLNVVLPIVDRGDYPTEFIEFAKTNKVNRATTLLKKLTTYYPGKDNDKFMQHNVSINYLVKEGIFAPTIIQIAEELACELIIAGTKSGHHLSKILLGSTVKELIRKTTIPTLIIPEGFGFKAIKNIAFATTLEGEDDMALCWVRQFAKTLSAKVFPFFISELPYDISKDEEEVWESKSLPLEAGNLSTVKVIRKVSFSAGVDYYLGNHPTDILAMFIPKRGFLQELFHFSKTQQMVINTNVPLLIYHA